MTTELTTSEMIYAPTVAVERGRDDFVQRRARQGEQQKEKRERDGHIDDGKGGHGISFKARCRTADCRRICRAERKRRYPFVRFFAACGGRLAPFDLAVAARPVDSV